MLEKASMLGDSLVVIVNNDNQAVIKKGKAFMPQEDRLKIVKALALVDSAFVSIDKDSTVCKSLKKVAKHHSSDRVIFANGGDRAIGEVPESKVCLKYGIEMVDGLGDKIRSSSELVANSK